MDDDSLRSLLLIKFERVVGSLVVVTLMQSDRVVVRLNLRFLFLRLYLGFKIYKCVKMMDTICFQANDRKCWGGVHYCSFFQ